MHILTSFEQLRELRGNRQTCLTVGVFDGVHLGHQKLIRTTVEQARDAGLMPVVVTFKNHPLSVLAPPYCPKSLLTVDRKLELIASYGAEAVIALPFTTDFAAIDPRTFVQVQLAELAGAAIIICGYDFTFGHKGTGNIDMLRQCSTEYGFSIHQLPAIEEGKVPVKSTHIRDLLAEGNVARAADLLTRPHELTGTVVHGNARGRTIGFPTANLEIPGDMQVPARGVYICAARAMTSAELLPAMVNIGFSPTFGENQLSIEAHILEFSGDVTGQQLSLYFLERIRDEQRFGSVQDLIAQLNLDREVTVSRWNSPSNSARLQTIPPPLFIR